MAFSVFGFYGSASGLRVPFRDVQGILVFFQGFIGVLGFGRLRKCMSTSVCCHLSPRD